MTEEEVVDPTLETEIEFSGRKMFVRMPRPEQLIVWKRTLDRLQAVDGSDWNGAQVMAALERARKIVDSVLVHPTDVEWLDDEMLAGRVDLKDTTQIILKAVEAFGQEGNREERRAAKTVPAKKATRKAAR